MRLSTVIKEKSDKYAFALEIHSCRFYLGFEVEQHAKDVLNSLNKAVNK
jgi:hypothetical protein